MGCLKSNPPGKLLFPGRIISVKILFFITRCFRKRFQVYGFEDIYPGTGEISDEGKEGDIFEIPAEIDFFQSHSYDTGSGADDEDTSAYSGTIWKGIPRKCRLV